MKRSNCLGVCLYTNQTLINELKAFGYANEKIAAAMLEIDRKNFVRAGQREYAYIDAPLPIGRGQTTSAPSVIAAILSALGIGQGMSALEIGVGSGYQTALLSKLVGADGRVIGVEIIPELAAWAKENIGKYKLNNVELVTGNGAAGYPQKAPYDRIVYSAAVKNVPESVIAQLKNGGKLIAPVGDFYQALYLFEKHDGEVDKTDMGRPVVFVPLM